MIRRQVALPTEETDILQIILICTSQTIASMRRDLRHIGGSGSVAFADSCS